MELLPIEIFYLIAEQDTKSSIPLFLQTNWFYHNLIKKKVIHQITLTNGKCDFDQWVFSINDKPVIDQIIDTDYEIFGDTLVRSSHVQMWVTGGIPYRHNNLPSIIVICQLGSTISKTYLWKNTGQDYGSSPFFPSSTIPHQVKITYSLKWEPLTVHIAFDGPNCLRWLHFDAGTRTLMQRLLTLEGWADVFSRRRIIRAFMDKTKRFSWFRGTDLDHLW